MEPLVPTGKGMSLAEILRNAPKRDTTLSENADQAAEQQYPIVMSDYPLFYPKNPAPSHLWQILRGRPDRGNILGVIRN